MLISNSTHRISAIAVASILLLSALGQNVLADNVQNDVIAGGNDTFYSGGSTIVNYKIRANNGDGQNGCNAADATPATVTINVPAGVTKSPSSLTFTSCETDKPVTFSSSTPGDYIITVSVSDGGAGAYNVNPARFTLHVLAPLDTTAPVITYTVTGTLGANNWYTSNVGVAWTVTDPESSITSTSGCDPSTITADTAGTTLTCTATSAGGTASNSVTIKRDATAPSITGTASPSANPNGWNNGDVTIHFTCIDNGPSGIASCPSDIVLSDENTGTIPTIGTAVDNAGNSMAVSIYVKIDRTSPTISATVSPAANAAGWHNSDVLVSFSCMDSLSDVDSCSGPVSLPLEGEGQSATGTATDKAGNTASITVKNINIDKTAPTITGSRTPSANTNGWNNSPVTVSFSCDDALSGISSCPQDTLLNEGLGQTVTATAVDNAGNTASDTVSGINIDLTPPTISISLDPATPNGANGWYITPVTVHFSCSDSLSGLATACPADIVLSEGPGQSALGTATDAAGNSASASVSGINIDLTSPTITGFKAPGANSNGWNNEDVTIHFECVDAVSGIASCPADTILGEGAGQSATGTATDNAGNSASTTVGGINIDKTSPVNVAFTNGGIVDGETYYFGFVPSAPTACSAADELSGMDSCNVSGGGTSVGLHSYTATAYDKAGNLSTHIVHYTVSKWSLSGFYQPIDMNTVQNVAKAGKVVPTKWTIYAGTTELTNTATFDSMGWKSIACGTSTVTDVIETYSTDTGNTELRYDPVAHQFVKNIKVPTTLGCYQLVLKTDDGSFIGAVFNVVK